MVYIPGPGAKNTPESIKKPIIEKNDEQTVPMKEEKKKRRPRKERIKISSEMDMPRSKKTKNTHSFFLYLCLIIAVFFSVAAFLKMYSNEKATNSRLDAMSAKYNSWYQDIKQQSEETYNMLKPNGWFNQAVISAHLIEDYLIGIDDIINISQLGDFKNLGYCRLFISGNSPVWISIEGNSKTLFGKNVSPGLSEEQFYYYKEPKVILEDKTIIVPRNFKITSGNYEDTYILFFNFGSTKMVKMNARSINNVPGAFNIWLPAN
ncbi:MAG TPA: hypothetical protein PLI77_07235 [Bacteroidales bacterium]|nr:hypothetical protein [Bacteroidales bacterium]HRW33617.1 hypothetical protein [Thermotogota bacterium]